MFHKRHFEKNKNPNPVRNWGAPRKSISRRRDRSNKSRGLPKALEVWRKKMSAMMVVRFLVMKGT